MSSGQKEKEAEVLKQSLSMNDHLGKSTDTVFYDCTTGPPKPSRILSWSPEPPPRKTKVNDDNPWNSNNLENESLLFHHKEAQQLSTSKANGNDDANLNFPQMPAENDKPDANDLIKLESIEAASKKPNSNNDYSNFVQKKSIAQGMMDLALVSANTNQLRYVMDMDHNHPYYATSLTLIISSLILQVVVGLALLYSNRFNLRKQNEMKSADRLNNLSIIGVFMITLINVFISTFNGSGAAPKPPVTNTTVCPVCPGDSGSTGASMYDYTV